MLDSISSNGLFDGSSQCQRTHFLSQKIGGFNMFRSITKLRSAIGNRLAVLVIMMALLGFFSLGGPKYFTTQTSAGPCQIQEYYYYNDVNWTTLVGYKIIPCSGGAHVWGVVTEFVDYEEGGCCGACCD
jgi:hypothetical protein